MPLVRLEKKELPQIIENIEKHGGDASKLRDILNNGGGKSHPGNPVSEVSDDELVAMVRKDSPGIEEGEGLICSICQGACSRITSGVCDSCFRDWAISCREGYLKIKRNSGGNNSD